MLQTSPLPAPLIHTRSTAPSDDRWALSSALVGAGLWLAAPLLPWGSAPAFASIEHTFLLLPLVIAPLALRLLSVLDPAGESRAFGLAKRLQPVAGALVLASFFVPAGRLAGGLTIAWLGMAVVTGLDGVRRPANLSLLASRVFLLVGAVWLLMARLGLAPRDLAALTVLLAALHFHFSGFALQVLVAATGVEVRGRGPMLQGLHRGVAAGTVAGLVLIAAGNLLHAPLLKALGVAAMVVSTVALAITSMAAAVKVSSPGARLLLLVSAGSLAAAMSLAGVYGLGEVTGRALVGLPRMVALHGALNAVGFMVCGLLGHLRLRAAGPSTSWPSRSRAAPAQTSRVRSPAGGSMT